MPVLIVAAASVFLVGGAQAQKKNEPAAGNDSLFTSDSRLVLVDAIVTDRNGAYIGDLTRKDFKGREDGKEQALTSFSYLADGTPDGPKHCLVLLFDDSTVAQTVRDAAGNSSVRRIDFELSP